MPCPPRILRASQAGARQIDRPGDPRVARALPATPPWRLGPPWSRLSGRSPCPHIASTPARRESGREYRPLRAQARDAARPPPGATHRPKGTPGPGNSRLCRHPAPRRACAAGHPPACRGRALAGKTPKTLSHCLGDSNEIACDAAPRGTGPPQPAPRDDPAHSGCIQRTARRRRRPTAPRLRVCASSPTRATWDLRDIPEGSS